MSSIHNIKVGIVEKFTALVTPETTIAHLPEHACFDKPLPRILSTPVLIKFMEMTAGMLIRPHLPNGWICLGTMVNVSHLAPAPEGTKIKICATVTEVKTKELLFLLKHLTRLN